MRRAGFVAIVLGVGLLMRPASAQTIGNVVCHNDTALRSQSGREDDWQPIQENGVNVVLGGWLSTNPTGALSVALVDPEFASVRSAFTLGPKTTVEVTEQLLTDSSQSARIVRVHGGDVLFTGLGTGMHVLAGNECTVTSENTEFVVTYDQDSEIATIVGVKGHVAVANSKGRVSVGAQDSTTVRPGAPPSQPIPLGDVEFANLLRRFAFVGGGRAESQAKLSVLARGAVLVAEDRAPWKGAPSVQTDNGPPVSDPPFVQPPDIVQLSGVGIEF